MQDVVLSSSQSCEMELMSGLLQPSLICAVTIHNECITLFLVAQHESTSMFVLLKLGLFRPEKFISVVHSAWLILTG